MSKKRAEVRDKPRLSPSVSKAHPTENRGAPRRPRLSGWQLWFARIALAAALPVLLLAIEGALRLAGWGYPTSFCLRQPAGAAYTQNDRFLWQFYSRKTNLRPNPFVVAVNKPADTVRIVVLGESAAAGTPEPAYGFARILERMLQYRFPQRRIQVINAAMPGVNSHILVRVARDCACLQPDFFVVYMGNNESVGLYAPGPRSGKLTPHRSMLRALQWVRATRLGQLLEPWLSRFDREAVSAEAQDEAFFENHRLAADDPRRAAIYDNFRANLKDICRAARRAGAGVALLSVPVNLMDCPPFGSLHRAGLSDVDRQRWETACEDGGRAEAEGQYAKALESYQAAAALDDHFAELHFRKARCLQALGRFDAAREEFVRARDWDALQFRTDSKLNEIIKDFGKGHDEPPVRIVDAEKAFRDSEFSDHGIIGGGLFHDNVHLNFDGDYQIARTLAPVLSDALTARLGPAARGLLSREECATRLAFTRVNEGQMEAQMLKTTALPPFTGQLEHARRQKAAEQRLADRFAGLRMSDVEKACQDFRSAMQEYPEDWQLPFSVARLLLLKKDFPEAITQFRAARRLMPNWVPIRIGLAVALDAAGKQTEAMAELTEAQALEPESEAVKAAMAATRQHSVGGAAHP